MTDRATREVRVGVSAVNQVDVGDRAVGNRHQHLGPLRTEKNNPGCIVIAEVSVAGHYQRSNDSEETKVIIRFD